MIKKLNIKNFQSHKDTSLEFCDGLNVFVGNTNSGKSAIFRALSKLFRNNPSGSEFINVDSDNCNIEVDDVILKLRRNDKGVLLQNTLFIGTKPFDKLGRGLPPDELFDHVQLSKPIKIGGVEEDFNFVLQKDPTFLISKTYTPSTVARFFDHLSGVSVLNTCVQEVKSREATVQSNLKSIQLSKKETKAKLEKLNYIDTLKILKIKLERIEEVIAKLALLRELGSKMSEKIKQMKEAKRVMDLLQLLEIIEKAAFVNILFQNIIKFHNINRGLAALPKFADVDSLRAKSSVIHTLLHLYQVNSIERVEDLSKVAVLVKQCAKLKLYANLCNLDQVDGESLGELNVVAGKLTTIRLQRDELVQSVDICPFCRRVI